MSSTATKVTKRDALAVIKAILNVSRLYVCTGHGRNDKPCDGMCKFAVARKLNTEKTYAEMDATPTLCTHEREELRPGCWSIFWEGGDAPDEWVYDESGDLARRVHALTDGRVFIEPINNCILGVYPA
jgi:hypothetical protein